MADYQSLYRLSHKLDADELKWERERRLHSLGVVFLDFPVGENKLFYVITPELAAAAERVYALDREVRGIEADMPPIGATLCLRALSMGNAVSSNTIEGVHSSRREMEDGFIANSARAKKTVKYVGLAGFYERVFVKGQLPKMSLEGIRTVFDEAVAPNIAAEEQPDGRLFRAEPINVYGTGQRILYRGMHPEKKIVDGLETMLGEWERPSSTRLVAALLGHIMFELVHPFYDGNGRTGRLLMAVELSTILSRFSALAFAGRLEEKRRDYLREFRELERPFNLGEATGFLIFLLDELGNSMEDFLGEIREKAGDFKNLHAHLRDSGVGVIVRYDLGDNEKTILELLAWGNLAGLSQGVELRAVADIEGAPRNWRTIRGALDCLVEKGFAEITRQRPLFVRLSSQAENALMGSLE